MRFLFFPLRYLKLLREDGKLLLWRDLPVFAILLALILLPFTLIHGADFFGKEGFVDRFGALASTLTGFYVAALVLAATFTTENGDLDKPIEVGPVSLLDQEDHTARKLSRREYVCIMFGYLSFISFALSVLSVIFVIVSGPLSVELPASLDLIGAAGKTISKMISYAGMTLFAGLASHLMITTCYGLYYLVDRLYAKKPVILPRKD